jgi:hypothetical protein
MFDGILSTQTVSFENSMPKMVSLTKISMPDNSIEKVLMTFSPPAAPLPPSQARNSGRRSNVVNRKHFSPEEDRLLSFLISVHGTEDWMRISRGMDGRNMRQCRERWRYYLEPGINRSDWTKEEDDLLLTKCAELGTKWSQLVPFFPARTDIDIKNHYHRIQRGLRKFDDADEATPSRVRIPSLSACWASLPEIDSEFRNPPQPPREAPPTHRVVSAGNTGQRVVKRIICARLENTQSV